MNYDMILAGVGGQGVLSIAVIIAQAAADAGLHLKQSEVHGMSQRGGSVESHLRLADHAIHSDLIPVGHAELLLAMEPMEALRYVPFLAQSGAIVTDRTPVVNIPNYPAPDEVYAALEQFPCVRLVDANRIARDLHAPRASNMALLGAASAFLPLPAADLEAAIRSVFGRKGETVAAQNIAVFRAGREAGAAA